LNWNFRLACELAHYTPKGLEAGRIFPWSMFSRSSEAKAPAWKARRALQSQRREAAGRMAGKQPGICAGHSMLCPYNG